MNIAKRIAGLAVMSFVIIVAVSAALPPAGAQSPPMTLLKLSDDVYAMQHPTGAANSIFAVTDEGVVVWDADIRSADLVLAAIRRTTGQADLDEAQLYFTAMRGQVASLMAQGKTEAQAIADFKVPPPFEKYGGADAH